MRTIQKDVVNAFIFSEDCKVLFGKSLRGSYEGCWLTPGGGIEAGESKKQALLREVMEEVGIDISGMDIEHLKEIMTGTSRKILKDTEEEVIGEYRFHNFIVKTGVIAADIPPQSFDDFSEATWHDVGSLEDLQMPPGSQKVLKNLGHL